MNNLNKEVALSVFNLSLEKDEDNYVMPFGLKNKHFIKNNHINKEYHNDHVFNFQFYTFYIKDIHSILYLKYGCFEDHPDNPFIFLSISQSQYDDNHLFFKDYYEERFAFLHPINKDKKSIELVNELIKRTDVNIQVHTDETDSLNFIIERLTKSYQSKIDGLLYKKNNFINGTGKYKVDFAKSLLEEQKIEYIEKDKRESFLYCNDFTFINKKITIENHGDYNKNQELNIKYGYNNENKNDKIIVIEAIESGYVKENATLFLFNLTDNNKPLNYRKTDFIILESLDTLNEKLKSIINEFILNVDSENKLIKFLNRNIVYGLYRIHSGTIYDEGSRTSKSLMAVSDSIKELKERYNTYYANDNTKFIDSNSITYNGSTGGGYSSSHYKVEIKEFESFDDPKPER